MGESEEAARGDGRSAGDSGPAPLLRSRRGAVLVLILNDPARANTLSSPMYRALTEAVSQAEQDGGIRAVVLTGADPDFCLGADLGEGEGGAASTLEERRRLIRIGQEANRRLQGSPLPIVAAVNGDAIGAGLELALSADLLVLARDAHLRFPGAALGSFVGGGVTYTLPRRVGLARAKELLLLARGFTAEEALRWNLANEVSAPGATLSRAVALAEGVATRAPRSCRFLKSLLAECFDAPAERLLEREEEALLACMETSDRLEGLRALHEGRVPRFTGA